MRVLIIADIMHAPHRVIPWCNNLSKFGAEVTLISPNTTRFQKRLVGYHNNGTWRHIETKRFFSLTNLFLPLGNRLQLLAQKTFFKMKLLTWKLQSKDLKRYVGVKIPRESFHYEMNWIKPAVNRIKYEAIDFDIIVSSSSPFSCHILGAFLSKTFHKPWVADYRDLFSQNHTLKNDDSKSELYKLECQILSQASLLITVSHGFADELRGNFDVPVVVLYNAVSSIHIEDFMQTEKSQYHLGYFGSVYLGFQNPIRIIQTIEGSDTLRNRVILHFFGPSSWQILHELKERNIPVPDFVRFEKTLTADKSLQMQRMMDYLMIFDWEDDTSKGVIPTKFSEYLGAAKPILCFGLGCSSELISIIEQTGSGISASNEESNYEILMNIVSGQLLLPKRNDELIMDFHMDTIVAQLIQHLRAKVKG
jgi:hypothetical protein